jgi:hypothetical protein
MRFQVLVTLACIALTAGCADDTKPATATDTAAASDTAASDASATDTAKTDTVQGDTPPADASQADTALDVPADAPDAQPDTAQPPKGLLAVVGSDFKTTSVSLVDPLAGKAVAPKFLHSGSAVTPGGTALSGDVVLAQPSPNTQALVVVDRGNGVLSWVDVKEQKVTAQLNVATGFYANPQDYVAVLPPKAYVPRLGQNPKPTADANDFDEGDDLLVIATDSKKIAGRIPLTPTATGLVAAAGRPAMLGGKVYVPNANLSADFKKIGPARVAVVDPGKDAVVDGPITDKALNCVKAAAAGAKVIVTCGGFFGDGADQYKKSALLALNPATAPATLEVLVAASAIGKAAFGKDLACDGGWCVAVTNGDFAAKTNDELWLVDVATGKATSIAKAGGAFALSGLFTAPGTNVVFAGEAFNAAGDVRVFALQDGKATELPALTSNPGGLGAVELAGVPAP